MRNKRKRKITAKSASIDEKFVVGLSELEEIKSFAMMAYLEKAVFNYLDDARMVSTATVLKGLEELLKKYQVEPSFTLNLTLPPGKEIKG